VILPEAYAPPAGRVPHRRVALLVGCLSQAFGAGRLDLLDLLLHEAKSVNVPPEFGQRVRRYD
jgi:hypothetical protein